MPVITQKWITRKDLQRNPDKLYVFGDNLVRKGYGGQARQMRGEQNAVGIATKVAPSTDPSAFFYDKDYYRNCSVIRKDFERVFEALDRGQTVVFPEAGIGTDRAAIAETAPRTAAFLMKKVEEMMAYNQAAAPELPGL